MLRFNEFGVDGGPAAKELVPKLNVLKKSLSSKLGVALPNIDVRPFCLSPMIFSFQGLILL